MINLKSLLSRIALSFTALIISSQLASAQNWNLVWQDEFNNGISGDWNFEVNGNGGGNNELQYYRQENAAVENGALVITAKQENFGGKTYTSARMTTQNKKAWKYGKIEARIAAPSIQGIWPAFWMLGSNISSQGWPKCGEIDIMEHVNTGNTNYGTIHWNSDANTHVEYSGNTQVNNITTYHTYTVEWTANSIKWFIDGNQFWIADITNGVNSTSEFHENFFIILNLAVGGNWPGNNIGAMPAKMYIDYVRVYQDGVVVIPPTTDVVTAYKDCNYTGFSGGLPIGDYNLAALKKIGIQDDDISSLEVAEGYKVILYQDDNFGGTSTTITANSACFNTTWNDKVTSLKVLANGATNMQASYFLQNRNSGLFMDIVGGTGNTADGAQVQQWNTAATDNQLFDFTHLGNGMYKIIARHSGKALDVDAAIRDNGAKVQQWTSANSVNQQFIVFPTGDGFYKIIPRFSGKVVEVAGASKALEAKVQQWENKDQTCGQWKFLREATAPVVSITAPANNYTVNAPASFTITATATDAESSVSKVEFFNGAAKLGEDATSPYTFAWNNVAAGTYTITAKATNLINNSTTSAAIKVIVNKEPTVSITSPVNNASFVAAASISITATAADADGNISKVEFYNGTTLLNSDADTPYAYNWVGVGTGTYSLTAKAYDNTTGETTSTIVSITVKANVLPTISFTAPANNASYTVGSAITMTANATDSDGSVSKVEFYNGTTLLGTAATSPYTYTLTNAPAGIYKLTAVATDNNTGKTTSSVITVNVSQPTDITDIENPNHITIYPNPTTGTLTVGSGVETVEVFTVNGQSLAVFDTKEQSPIDITTLQSGMYIFKITGAHGIHYEKIMKTN